MELPNCSKLGEFNAISAFYEKLAYSEQRDVLKLTNCKLPCQYREIKAAESPITQNYKDNSGLTFVSFNIVTTDLKVETEAFVYNFSTLVSNFGGSLGLFLGFSFFMFWDWIVSIWMSMKWLRDRTAM